MIAAWRMTLDGRWLPLDHAPVSDWLRADFERLRRRPGVLWDADPETLGAAFDRGDVSEVWCAISGMLGGDDAAPVGGEGVAEMAQAWRLEEIRWRCHGADLVIEGRVAAGNPVGVKKQDDC